MYVWALRCVINHYCTTAQAHAGTHQYHPYDDAKLEARQLFEHIIYGKALLFLSGLLTIYLLDDSANCNG